MANIINIGTAVPAYKHQQKDILAFMQNIYQLPEKENRVLKFLYDHSGIESRYSIIPDYSYTYPKSNFIPDNRTDVFPLLEERMKLYETQALDLSVTAINKAIDGYITPQHITHLITISCTGMSAPGLDLQLMELLHLAPDIFRSSINFMGCYAAIHGLKMAKMICDSTPNANVVIVATEICTLHFQKEYSEDNAASSLLFADGAAAVFISNQITSSTALQIDGFYATVANKGKDHMAWELSSKGFLMRLSSYIPQLIESDINALVAAAMEATGNKKEAITDWCIHPGGKRILDLIEKKLGLADHDLLVSREVLQEHGNMSSPTVLFVLKKLMERSGNNKANMMGMAFGPGLTHGNIFCKPIMNFTKRSGMKELLDGDHIPFEDILLNMRELNTINTLLGGHAITIAGFKKIAGNKKQVHICEIGCGGGDNLVAVYQYAKKNEIELKITGIDIKKECIAVAQQRTELQDATLLVSDYRAIAFDKKPDIIFSSLFCHHFSHEALVQQILWMQAGATTGFFINDLQRHRLAYYAIKLLTQLFSSSYLVKNDAPLSVARGFVKAEWESILDEADVKKYLFSGNGLFGI